MRSKCCWLCHRWCNWDKSWSLPSQFHLLVWSCGLIWDVWWGIPRTLNPVDLGWRHAGMWTSCASRICLWGHVGLWDRRSVGISHRGGFVGTSHRDRACVGISHSAWVVGTSHRSGVFDTAYSLGGQMFLPDIFPTLSHTCFIGVSEKACMNCCHRVVVTALSLLVVPGIIVI